MVKRVQQHPVEPRQVRHLLSQRVAKLLLRLQPAQLAHKVRDDRVHHLRAHQPVLYLKLQNPVLPRAVRHHAEVLSRHPERPQVRRQAFFLRPASQPKQLQTRQQLPLQQRLHPRPQDQPQRNAQVPLRRFARHHDPFQVPVRHQQGAVLLDRPGHTNQLVRTTALGGNNLFCNRRGGGGRGYVERAHPTFDACPRHLVTHAPVLPQRAPPATPRQRPQTSVAPPPSAPAPAHPAPPRSAPAPHATSRPSAPHAPESTSLPCPALAPAPPPRGAQCTARPASTPPSHTSPPETRPKTPPPPRLRRYWPHRRP